MLQPPCSNLVGRRLGYFDLPDPQPYPYRQLGWSDVNTPEAQQLALTAAVEDMVPKNDGTLSPMSPADLR